MNANLNNEFTLLSISCLIL